MTHGINRNDNAENYLILKIDVCATTIVSIIINILLSLILKHRLFKYNPNKKKYKIYSSDEQKLLTACVKIVFPSRRFHFIQ